MRRRLRGDVLAVAAKPLYRSVAAACRRYDSHLDLFAQSEFALFGVKRKRVFSVFINKKPLYNIDHYIPIHVFINNLDKLVFSGFEAKLAEGVKAAVFAGRFLLIDPKLGFAIGVSDGYRSACGSILELGVGDANFVVAA